MIPKSSYPAALLLALMLAPPAATGVTYLDHQHMDFRLRYYPLAEGTNQLDIVLGFDQGTDRFTETNQQVYIVGNANAQLTIPGNPNYAFLGEPGSPVWILPQSQNVTLPYIGVSGEDLPTGVFDGPLDLELRDVRGPGDFFVWSVSGAGQPPLVKMLWTNGVLNTNFNKTSPLIGSHEHFNWGFSTNGLYNVTFRCAGRRLGESTNLVGRDVTWSFQILPLRPWEAWQSTNWLPATAVTTNGPAADPDHDAIVNAMEYALALDPNVASTNGLPTFSWVTNGPNVFGALTFNRAKWATDLDYEPSVSHTLDGGAWVTLTNTVSVVDHGETETVTVRDSARAASTSQRFYQLRVRLNYP